MPQVTLDLVSLDDKPVAGASCRFEAAGGTIGRDEGNTLALPDPHRRVSRLHATISFPGEVPTITNSSTVLNIDAGGAQLKSGQAMALAQGMRLGIGPYVLVVSSCEGSAGAAPQDVLEPTQRLAALAPAGVGPFAGPSSPDAPAPSAVPIAGAPLHPVDDPLAGLLGSAVSTPRTPASRPAAAAELLTGAGSQASPASADPFSELMRAPPSGADPLAALGKTPSAGADPLAGLASAPSSSADPLAGLGHAPAAGIDPFAALSQAAPSDADPFAALGRHPHQAAAPAQPPAILIPEDFNPFDLPSASARNSADPLASMLGSSGAGAPHALVQAEESIDALFAPGGAASGDPFLAAMVPAADAPGGASGAASSLLAQPDNGDPLALFADAARPENLGVPMRDDLAEIGGAYQPPRALEPQPAARPMPQQAAAPRGTAQTDPFQPSPMPVGPSDALARAFLTGAQLPPAALPHGLTPEVMALLGALLRSATAGTIDMLAVRANIKREVQASVTIISTEANNPLKFLPNAEAVLLQFLGRAMPGFMRPDEAMDDAYNDLRAHELGVIAGTRAALDEVLAKFDPATLGERLIRGSLLEKALPAMRKTRLWDLYLERYAQLRREVEDDFQSVFGKAFVAAYESETARMKARSPDRGA